MPTAVPPDSRPGNILLPRVSMAASLCLLLASIPSLADTVGLVSDNGSRRVNMFNADLDTITSQIDAAPGYAAGDCAISSNMDFAYATSSGNEVSFINLVNGGDQTLAHGGQVPISNLGVDMALSPDDAFLVVSGGGVLQQPLSVVDTRLGAEVSTSGLFADHTSVEFCDNGTLLVTTTNGERFGGERDNALYDATIDGAGNISLAGSRLSSGQQPNNAACAPGSLAGVLLDRNGGLTSFTIPGLQAVAHTNTGDGAAVSAVFSADGNRLFVRSAESVQSFEFNPVTAGMTLLWEKPAARTSRFYGIDQIALHPGGNKLYVDGGTAMLILDSESGAQSGLIPMGDTTGICFANRSKPVVGAALVQTDSEPVLPSLDR